MHTACSELVVSMYWTGKSMNNLLVYCGLVYARIRASNKDLPVPKTFWVQIWAYKEGLMTAKEHISKWNGEVNRHDWIFGLEAGHYYSHFCDHCTFTFIILLFGTMKKKQNVNHYYWKKILKLLNLI